MIQDADIWKLAQDLKKGLTESERQELTHMLDQWQALSQRLESRYQSLVAQIYNNYDGADAPPPRHLLLELEQTKLALADTMLQVDLLAAQWAEVIERRQLEMFDIANADALQLLQMAIIDAGLDIGVASSVGGRLPAEAVQKLLEATVNGAPLRDLLESRFGDRMNAALEVLVDGVALGLNPKEVARNMIKALDGYADNAILIARTESLRAYRLASTESYRQAGGIVRGHKRVATRDTRTCLACLMADGQVYPIDKEIEEHPNGRCTSIPLLRDMPDPVWQQGPEWFQTLDPGTQREMLGPGRYDAWKAGKFELSDLITVKKNSEWGDSLQPTPLKDL